MSYHIEMTENPIEYKDQIIRMWQESLSDTPPDRFNWLINAAGLKGKVNWFLALDSQSKSLLGFITLMPREFFWKGKKVLVGIMGDFVVDKQCRGFGPGLKLPKIVLDRAADLGFRLIYTIPYYGTIKHSERAGLRYKVKLWWLIKPLDLSRYVRIPVAKHVLNFVVFLFDKMSYSLFLNSLVLRGCNFVEEESIGQDFDRFWEKLKQRGDVILGSRDSRYLTWRYLKNPLLKFRVLTSRGRYSKELLGYVIFTINGRKLDVYDIQYLQEKVKHLLLQKVIWIARRERCEALYILTSASGAWQIIFKLFGFIPSAEEHPLCYSALDSNLCLDSWRFLQGDRNV